MVRSLDTARYQSNLRYFLLRFPTYFLSGSSIHLLKEADMFHDGLGHFSPDCRLSRIQPKVLQRNVGVGANNNHEWHQK